jgi:hypothetical protein
MFQSCRVFFGDFNFNLATYQGNVIRLRREAWTLPSPPKASRQGCYFTCNFLVTINSKIHVTNTQSRSRHNSDKAIENHSAYRSVLEATPVQFHLLLILLTYRLRRHLAPSLVIIEAVDIDGILRGLEYGSAFHPLQQHCWSIWLGCLPRYRQPYNSRSHTRFCCFLSQYVPHAEFSSQAVFQRQLPTKDCSNSRTKACLLGECDSDILWWE